MSLGWSTESALVPGKAKEISVPSSSMLGLKAQLAEASSSPRRRKVDEQKRNRGVEERSGRDKRQVTMTKAQQSRMKLEAKARLYEELSAGTKQQSSDDDFLVDFSGGGERRGGTRRRLETDEEHGAGTRWAWSTGKDEESQTKILKSQWEKTLTEEQKKVAQALAVETDRGRDRARAKTEERERRRKELAARLATKKTR